MIILIVGQPYLILFSFHSVCHLSMHSVNYHCFKIIIIIDNSYVCTKKLTTMKCIIVILNDTMLIMVIITNFNDKKKSEH